MIVEESEADVMVLMTNEELEEQIKTDFTELKSELIKYSIAQKEQP
jgi:hypothetical protein